MQKSTCKGLALYQFSHLSALRTDLIHLVSTRLGGVSTGPYESLNLSFSVGDKPERVLENRRRLCRAAGVALETLTLAEQVHRSNICVVPTPCVGIKDVDAMITDQAGVSLVALSADCPLIMCYDPVKKVIAMIHASWRGMVGDIIQKTIHRMRQDFGCRPQDIIAAISPAIGPCCYEVKQDFIDIMSKTFPFTSEYLIKKQDKAYFDLWQVTKKLLTETGLSISNIESADMCTKCNPDLFYSFRLAPLEVIPTQGVGMPPTRTGGGLLTGRDDKTTGRFCCLINIRHGLDKRRDIGYNSHIIKKAFPI